MEQLFFCTRWGSEDLPWNDFAQKVKTAGYDGIESSLPYTVAEQDDMLRALDTHHLKLIGVHWDTVTPDFNKHKEEMEQRLSALIKINPLFITSHTGKDHFTFDQNVELLSLAERMSNVSGVSILHETHRGKFSFAVHLMRPFLEKLPELKLTLDISHWFAVAESYLQDQKPALDLALAHTAHIHSRVGSTQGPQVNDPRNQEGQAALQQHLICWDRVIELQKNRGAQQFTFTPEFGPYPYMATKETNMDAAKHQWDINNYMKDILKSRYYAS
jgi:sugar phosphate isomerase/epimerase